MRRKKETEEVQESVQQKANTVESVESVEQRPRKKRRKKAVEVETEQPETEEVIEEKPKKKRRRKKTDGAETIEVHTKEQMTLAMDSILKEKFGFKTNSKNIGNFVMINSDCLIELVKTLDHSNGQEYKMPEEIPAFKKGMKKKEMIEILDLVLKGKYHISLSATTLKSFKWIPTNDLKEFIRLFV